MQQGKQTGFLSKLGTQPPLTMFILQKNSQVSEPVSSPLKQAYLGTGDCLSFHAWLPFGCQASPQSSLFL